MIYTFIFIGPIILGLSLMAIGAYLWLAAKKNDRRHYPSSCWLDIYRGSNSLYRVFYDHYKCAWIADRG